MAMIRALLEKCAYRLLLFSLPELRRCVDELVAEAGHTRRFYLREIIQRGAEDTEDYWLAVATGDRVRNGEERIYTAAEMREQFGLDDSVYRDNEPVASQAG
jgi:RHH-type rel operon transcriptional repressor/antitoxin RelB